MQKQNKQTKTKALARTSIQEAEMEELIIVSSRSVSDPSLKINKQSSTVAHAFNASTWET